ncbi:MAG TPA: polysaccharide deacetylase family protein [bacterium]|nr:polysaccharide deacetylase family protein [bacterium]
MREPLRLGLETVGTLFAAAACYTLGAYAATEGLGLGVIKRGPARPMMALTFDDGPDPEYTPRILDALAASGALATFFMVGRQIEAAPAVARAIVAAGHDVGNHTYGHRHLWSLTPAASVAEVDGGAAAVAEATGVTPRYFRPPWGTFNWPAFVRAGQIGETRVLWSVRPEGLVTAARADRMTALVVRKAHAGAIVNLHDHGGHASTPKETWAALPGMVAGLRRRGFDVVPLRVLLGA